MRYKILYNDIFRQEILPASDIEYKIVKKLKNIFSEYVDWVKYIDIPTSSWFEKECYLEISNLQIPCKALPYTNSWSIEGYYEKAILDKHVLIHSSRTNEPIYFIEFPEELDITKYIVLELYKKNAKAVVFYDKNPGIYRRTVIVGCKTYSFNHGSPPPIPVVSITREDYMKIKRVIEKNSYSQKIKLYINAYTKHDLRSKAIIVGINGSGEKEIHVTAHHDHWFTGFSDNLVGIESLYQIMRKARNWRGHNIVLISFSSEEIGAPYYASWYWAWGSRYYVRILYEKGDIEKIIANINIDAIYKYPLEIYGNPSLKKCIEKIRSKRSDIVYYGVEHMDFDSFSYTIHGVPSLTITTINTINPIYHSTIDNGSSIDKGIIEETIDIAYQLIKCINENKPQYRGIIEYIKNEFEKVNLLETRIILSKLENMKKIFSNENKLIHFITKNFVKPVYTPGLRLEHQTGFFAEITFINKVLNNLENYCGEIVEIYSYGEEIASITPNKDNIEECRKTLRSTIFNKTCMINRELEEKIAYYVLRNKINLKKYNHICNTIDYDDKVNHFNQSHK